jgi:hypothetical protein
MLPEPRSFSLRLPPAARFGAIAIFLAMLVYVVAFWQPASAPEAETDAPETTVAVPVLDHELLAKAKDDTREARLRIDREPLQHLLGQAIDVVPSVADALGMPNEPVPLEELRARPGDWRGRWLWYKGILEDVRGPQDGHPVPGYSIYEATVRLASGDAVLAAFSLAPTADVQRGGIVRVEGYLLKLQDAVYPQEITQAPYIVGRVIQRDYEEWGPVTELDPKRLEGLDDGERVPAPGSLPWRTIDEDQTEALWHLAAFARDTAKQRTPAEWRAIGTLNHAEIYEPLVQGKVARGAPLRVLGTLVKRTTIAAPTNPAGIKHWTIAWLQVRDFGGHVIPIWLPRRIELPLRAPLEVRAHYYRWFAYEGQQDGRFRVPLFVAAELPVLELSRLGDAGLGLTIAGGCALALMLFAWWAQRRTNRQSRLHEQEMDARRRRRRERGTADAAAGAPTTTS